MSRRIARLLPLILPFGGVLPLSQHAVAQQQPPRSSQWIADWGERRCALMRSVPGDEPLTFSLRIIPGNLSPEIHFVDPSWRHDPFDGIVHVTIVMIPSNERIVGEASISRLDEDGSRVLEVNSLPGDFFDKFATASAISIQLGSRELARIPTPQAAAAVQALHECNDALMRNWGVDPTALAALRSTPTWRSDPNWLTSMDYPRRAVDRGISGTTIFRYTVAINGRVSECVVVASSGDIELDQRTCQLFVERGNFRPATDSQGRPTAATQLFTVNWAAARPRAPERHARSAPQQ